MPRRSTRTGISALHAMTETARIIRKWGRRSGVGFPSYLSKDAQDVLDLLASHPTTPKRGSPRVIPRARVCRQTARARS